VLITNIEVLDWIKKTQARYNAEKRTNDVPAAHAKLLSDFRTYLEQPGLPLDPTTHVNAKMRNSKATVEGLVHVLKEPPYSLPKKYILQIFNIRPTSVDVLEAILEWGVFDQTLMENMLREIQRFLGPVESEAEAREFTEQQDRIDAEDEAKEGAD
jgi:hypothetical protein